jgi:hypothetical protein
MRFGRPKSYARHVRRQIRRSAVRETTEGADTIGEGRVGAGHTSIALEAKDENHQRRVPLSPCKSVTGWR